jgi:uncharacterized membrane protein
MGGLGNVPEAPASIVESTVTGVSFDGSVIVGGAVANESSNNPFQAAFRWTQEGGMMEFEVPGLRVFGSTLDISADGIAVVGEGSAGQGIERIFRWRPDEPLFLLVDFPEILASQDYRRLSAVSADGSTLYGEAGLVPGGPNPFLWDEVDGFTIPDDPTFPSGFGRRVSDVYADGFVGNVAGGDGESIG